MKSKPKSEQYTAFENLLRTVVAVPHSEIKAKLDELDRKGIRAVLAKTMGKGTKADDDTLADIDAQAEALRMELRRLTQ